MTVIDITHPKQIPYPWYGYLGMEEMEARQLCRDKHGYSPDTIYRKITPKGKVTFYIPVEEREDENHNDA